MAQDGDTITYTHSDGDSVTEDVSNVDRATIEYIDGHGGESGDSGGRVENVVVDLTGVSEWYIWVGGSTFSTGRYLGGATVAGGFPSGLGGSSTEISFSNTSQSDSDDEPFIAGAGGGGGSKGSGGARGGADTSDSNTNPGGGIAPPQGGDGEGTGGETRGDGAVNSSDPRVIDSGTTILGGGGGSGVNGEVQVSYQAIPDAPSNLSATLQ